MIVPGSTKIAPAAYLPLLTGAAITPQYPHLA